jgi:hypothetical protein
VNGCAFYAKWLGNITVTETMQAALQHQLKRLVDDLISGAAYLCHIASSTYLQVSIVTRFQKCKLFIY